MNLEKNINEKVNKRVFELVSVVNGKVSKKGFLISKKRVLIGSSETCDVVIPYHGINAVHAVVEITVKSFKIYDMNSSSGTFINGDKVISSLFELNDVVQLGSFQFIFKEYKEEDLLPPPLDVLTPGMPPVLPKERPREVNTRKVKNKIPTDKSDHISDSFEEIEYLKSEYPLAKDPKAQYSEYIFEDADSIYPIFNYQINKQAVEVIIIFKDQIYSVDYLPEVDGMFSLAGFRPKGHDIEYPYLRKDEKVPFISVGQNKVQVNNLDGYKLIRMTDSHNKEAEEQVIDLTVSDILMFHKGDIKIFVKSTKAPPLIKRAPAFGRDKSVHKYILIMLILITCFLAGMQFFKVDKELEKEKAPERIATILYKKKPIIRRPKKPKKVVKEIRPKKIDAKKNKKAVLKKVDAPKKKIAKIEPKKTAPPKKGTPPKPKLKRKVKKVVRKAPQPKKIRSVKNNVKKKSVKKSTSRRKAVKKVARIGRVDTYKSADFKSSLSSILSKGGGATVSKKDVSLENSSDSAVIGSSSDSDIKKTKVSQNIGSLAGAAQGRLDSRQGVEGLAKDKSTYTVGIPTAVVTLGSMDPDIIRKILQDHIPQFRSCYQRVLEGARSKFDGALPLDFIIGASGHVVRAGFSSSVRGLPANVQGCVISVLRGIKFPEPKGGGKVQVKQTMNFRARNR